MGNLNAGDFQSKSGSAEYFIPSAHYTLKAYDSSMVEEVLTNPENGAGATLDINSMTDGIENATASTADTPVSITYYNMDGTGIVSPRSGINIMKMTYADGRTVNKKIMR